MAKKTKSRSTKVSARRSHSSELVSRMEAFFDKIAPDFSKRLATAEMERDHAVSELKYLQERLVNLLTTVQLEAAVTCGITPELYAIEYVEYYAEKMKTLSRWGS